MISTTISTYGLALSYANQGWFIIPLHYPIAGQCSCGNPNCGSAAKHPISQIVPKGYLNGTVNKELIKSWWEKYPEANIGVVVGPHSNICVLDVDPRNGGDISFGNLIRVRGDLPATVQCLTGGGGQHYYFVYNLLFGVPKEFKKGIDIKRSGYVVAPGSQHISGKYYEWMSDQALGERVIIECCGLR
jgi:hypothetical protein